MLIDQLINQLIILASPDRVNAKQYENINIHIPIYTYSPIRVFLQHLVDADAESLIIVTFVDEVFIYTKLSSSDGLTLRDP